MTAHDDSVHSGVICYSLCSCGFLPTPRRIRCYEQQISPPSEEIRAVGFDAFSIVEMIETFSLGLGP